MDSRAGLFGAMDPTQVWNQWFEAGTKMWNDVIQGRQESLVDPYGLYRQWFEGMERARDMATGAMENMGGGANPMNMMSFMNPMTAMQNNPMAAMMQQNPMMAMMQNNPLGAFNPMAAMMAAGTNGSGESTPAAQGSGAGLDPGEAWRKWFEATTDSWQKSANLGSEIVEMTPRWMEMIAQSRDNMMAAQSFPKDPLEFAVQWYNATSGPVSEFVQDVIEREEFLAQSSRFMRNYATLYKIFSRNSEQYLKFFQLPVRSDITRVASLIVGLESKVDRLEEAFEEFEYGYAQPATAEAVSGLDGRLARIEVALSEEERGDGASVEGIATADAVEGLASRVDRVEGKLDRVERKLDSLLTALENVTRNGGGAAAPVAEVVVPTPAEAADAPAEEQAANGAGEPVAVAQAEQTEIKATDAARRKAAELGIELASVEGTGSDGQITVGDVRKKGES